MKSNIGMIDNHFPLIDLHRHLDGSVRVSTILDLGKKYGLNLPADTEETLRPYVQVQGPVPDILVFFEKFEWHTGILVDYEAVERVAYENVLDAKVEGIDYIELRFSPMFMSLAHKLEPASIVAAVVDGVKKGEEETQIRANLIGIISRTYGAETCMQEMKGLLKKKDDIVAMDLAGDEKNFPARFFEKHFRMAREAGWRATVHAGEADGPRSIREALDILKAERIGHAARIFEDPALVDRMREERIGIETNLTSNVQTTTVPDYASHPLKRMLSEGLLATINTDDPGISGIDLPYEYEVAAPKAGLTPIEAHQAQRNALEVAFLSETEKKELIRKKES